MSDVRTSFSAFSRSTGWSVPARPVVSRTGTTHRTTKPTTTVPARKDDTHTKAGNRPEKRFRLPPMPLFVRPELLGAPR